MKFDYLVKFNGVYYKPGEDVPMDGEKKPSVGVSSTPKIDKVVKTEPKVEEETVSTNTVYTKTDINRMSTADLKDLAKGSGVDDSLSGAELKKVLIDKLVK